MVQQWCGGDDCVGGGCFVGLQASKNLGGGFTIVSDAYPIENRPGKLSGDSTQ